MPVLVRNAELRCSNVLSHRCGPSVFFFRKCTVSPKKMASYQKQNKSRYRSASLTAEAAMVLPLFFFTIYIFWQCFLLLLVQLSVCREVAEITLKSMSLGYVERKTEEVEDLSWLYELLIWDALLDEGRIDRLSVSFEEEESGRIKGKVQYSFVCEALVFPMLRVPVVQSFCFMPYIGEYDKDLLAKEEETEEDVVYVAETGTVYHEVKTCVYLSVEVSAVNITEIENKRNSYGKKYTACSRCNRDASSVQVYISAGGTKYHQKADCSALKRMFEEKKREEVTLPACSKCGKEDSK